MSKPSIVTLLARIENALAVPEDVTTASFADPATRALPVRGSTLACGPNQFKDLLMLMNAPTAYAPRATLIVSPFPTRADPFALVRELNAVPTSPPVGAALNVRFVCCPVSPLANVT